MYTRRTGTGRLPRCLQSMGTLDGDLRVSVLTLGETGFKRVHGFDPRVPETRYRAGAEFAAIYTKSGIKPYGPLNRHNDLVNKPMLALI